MQELNSGGCDATFSGLRREWQKKGETMKHCIGITPLVALGLASGLCLLAQSPVAAQTYVNRRPVTNQQQNLFVVHYGTPLPPGNYWYDSQSGFWGPWGREFAGVLDEGHDFGPLPADASDGRTGVFINGRQLNIVEVLFFRRILGAVRPGRFWLDGKSGYFGVEGNAWPLGNVAAAMQAAPPRQRGVLTEHDVNGGFSNSAGTCTKSGNCYYPDR